MSRKEKRRRNIIYGIKEIDKKGHEGTSSILVGRKNRGV